VKRFTFNNVISTSKNQILKSMFSEGHENGNGAAGKEAIQLEQDILMPLAGTARAYVYTSTRWWSQLKTAGSAIYANRHYLQLYRQQKQHERLLQGDAPKVIGDVYVHPSASVHPTAVVK